MLCVIFVFQHTAARRRLHPRLRKQNRENTSFNTQPPEGGCHKNTHPARGMCLFQHTAARRRLLIKLNVQSLDDAVSTHSRPKAAAKWALAKSPRPVVSTHSRPKAAAPVPGPCTCPPVVSTHSRPKAAAQTPNNERNHERCFNTQPPEGGCALLSWIAAEK